MDSKFSPGSLGIELFTTSSGHNIKTKKDCYRLRSFLDVKKIHYVEIDLALHLWRRREMLKRSNGVDTLPQLHAYGKFIGDIAEIQDLEDHGELDEVLQPPLTVRDDTTDASNCTNSFSPLETASLPAATVSQQIPSKSARQIQSDPTEPSKSSGARNAPSIKLPDSPQQPDGQHSDGHLESSDESSLLGTLQGSSLAKRTASELATDRSHLESPSDFINPEISPSTILSTPGSEKEDLLASDSTRPIRETAPQSQQAEVDGDQSSDILDTESVAETQQPADFSDSSSQSIPTPAAALTHKDSAEGLSTPVWQPESASECTEDHLEKPTRKTSVMFAPARTATKEELASLRLGSQPSSAYSSLLGTATDSLDPGSESLQDSEDAGSAQSRPSPRAQLCNTASMSLSSAESIGDQSPRTAAPEKESDISSPETLLLCSPITTISVPSSRIGDDELANLSEDQQDLSVDTQGHQQSSEFMEGGVVASSVSSQAGRRSSVDDTDNENADASSRVLLRHASSLLTSITAAVEATQRRDYSEDDEASEGSDTSTAHETAGEAGQSDGNPERLGSVCETDPAMLPASPQGNCSPKLAVLSPTDSPESNKALMGSPWNVPEPAGEEQGKKLTLQQSRLAELDSLLSSSSLQQDGLNLDVHSAPEASLSGFPIKSRFASDWEFVEDTLSSRMQAIKRWTGQQAPDAVNQAFGITSETTDSMAELMAEIESHPIENWHSGGIEDSQHFHPVQDGARSRPDSNP